MLRRNVWRLAAQPALVRRDAGPTFWIVLFLWLWNFIVSCTYAANFYSAFAILLRVHGALPHEHVSGVRAAFKVHSLGPWNDPRRRPSLRTSHCLCPMFCISGGILVGQPSRAAEYAWGHYLLGVGIPMSGYTPSGGVFLAIPYGPITEARRQYQISVGGLLAAGLRTLT